MMYDNSRSSYRHPSPPPMLSSNDHFSSSHFDYDQRQKRMAAGLIVGAVKGIANVATTTVSAVTDSRTYYDCPRCGREVYAYGSFAGNVCLDCPGTVISSVGSTASMVTGTEIPQKIANSFASEATQVVTSVGGLVGNVATLQVTGGGNGTRADWCGRIIYTISKGSSSDDAAEFKSERIESVTSKSVGIRVAVADGTGFDHWWMNIETSKGYYQVQFRKQNSAIELRKCGSVDDCDQNGLKEANRDENVSPTKVFAYSKSDVSGRSLGDLISWLESGAMSSSWTLFNNNCQDLCKRIYDWI